MSDAKCTCLRPEDLRPGEVVQSREPCPLHPDPPGLADVLRPRIPLDNLQIRHVALTEDMPFGPVEVLGDGDYRTRSGEVVHDGDVVTPRDDQERVGKHEIVFGEGGEVKRTISRVPLDQLIEVTADVEVKNPVRLEDVGPEDIAATMQIDHIDVPPGFPLADAEKGPGHSRVAEQPTGQRRTSADSGVQPARITESLPEATKPVPSEHPLALDPYSPRDDRYPFGPLPHHHDIESD